MTNGVWAEVRQVFGGAVALVADPDPNIGSAGNVVRTTASGNSSNGEIRFALPSPQATEGIGFRLWQSQLPNSNNLCPWVAFRNTSNATKFALRFLTNGSIEARSGTNSEIAGFGTYLGETDGPAVTANAWNHVEIKALADSSAGTIEVRVEGIVVLTLDTQNTGASSIAQIACGVRASLNEVSASIYWKDVFFWDTTGSEVNDFQGSVSVYDLLPDADDVLNWTPSTGSTGWDLIDDNDGPDDADYVSADDTPPAASIFGMTNLPEDVTSVRAVVSIGRMMKTDGGDCDIQMSLSPNGTDWDTGSDRPITTAFTYFWDTSHVSPATSAAWTPAEVDALEFRIDRTL
jgi:hypothetical protein